MKKGFKIIAFGVLSHLATQQCGWAGILPDFARYFDQKLSVMEDSACSLPSGSQSEGSGMAIQDFNIDFIPSVTFGLNTVLSLTISPEIDFIFVPAPEDKIGSQ